jgi:hypothetical protein
MDIVKPISTPTPWVSSLVTVLKPWKLTIYIDPKHLNQNIKKSHYPWPIIEDLLLDLEFDDSGQISTKMYDKRDDFNFKIINWSLQVPSDEGELSGYHKGNNKITELRTILQRESQNS